MDGSSVELSKTEQKLLRLLIQNKGQTLTRDLLVDRIWTDGADYVDENALSVTVGRLRKKLNATNYIQTVYGIGYAWRGRSLSIVRKVNAFMYEELQVVKATKNLSDKVKMGCIGTIVYVYFEEKIGYEVEFFNADYETLDILTVGETDIEIVENNMR